MLSTEEESNSTSSDTQIPSFKHFMNHSRIENTHKALPNHNIDDLDESVSLPDKHVENETVEDDANTSKNMMK